MVVAEMAWLAALVKVWRGHDEVPSGEMRSEAAALLAELRAAGLAEGVDDAHGQRDHRHR
ncbi:MAG: hypothetical protein ACRD0A_10205 [Acidimicrobiales bacterium]